MQTKTHLTRRERDVLTAIGNGRSSKQAAADLLLSKRTVDFHLLNIFSKLKVENRIQAINKAHQLGLIGSNA